MSVLLLSGSPSLQSRTARLLDYTEARLVDHGLTHVRISVRELSPAALLHADFEHAEIIASKAAVAASRAVVIATPVYKAAYSGILKAFLDLLPQDGLRNKAILPLASGGSSAHLLALDYALRPVLAALGASIVLPSIYAVDKQIEWSQANGLVLGDDIARRLDEGVERLAETLATFSRQAGQQSASRASPPSDIAPARCTA